MFWRAGNATRRLVAQCLERQESFLETPLAFNNYNARPYISNRDHGHCPKLLSTGQYCFLDHTLMECRRG